MAKKEQFTASRKQLHRMSLITSLLKQKEWVTMQEILKRMDATEFTDGAYLGCGNRTVQRDIKILQDEYHAPIEYSKSERAYTLNETDWTFQVPALLNPDELLAVVIGGKLCQDIFPEGISEGVTRAVEEILRYNESDVFTSELLASLKVLTGGTADAPSDIFQAVFDAWKKRKLLRISYATTDGDSLIRDIEPHTLVFHDMRWSIKGFCHTRNDVRTFHVSRILGAAVLEQGFTPREDIIRSVTPDDFLDYTQISDVTLWINEAGRQFAKVYPLHSHQSFSKGDDGSYTMCVPSVSAEKLVPWVLRQMGNAKPLTPAPIVEKVREAIRNLSDVCQAYPKDEIDIKLRRHIHVLKEGQPEIEYLDEE